MKMLVESLCVFAIIYSSLADMDLGQCGDSAGCLRSPNKCTGDGCNVAAMWSTGTTNDVINFVITAKASGYVSIGFSNDKSMGNDSVIDCVGKDNDVILQASYNDGYSNDVVGITLEQAGLTLVSSSNSGGFITCEFTRSIRVEDQDKVFDLSQDYYVLLAYGSVATDNTKDQHSRDSRILSSDKMTLTVAGESESTSGRRSNLHKAHGVLMVAAWVVAAAMGMFVARHYKTAWPTKTLFGNAVWFIVHRILMVLALLCTVAAFIVIYIELDGEYTEFAPGDSHFKKAHPPMGIVITILVILNPVMTVFRCAPGDKRRPLFDLAHFAVGMSAFILASINIFSGVKLGGFRDGIMWVMAAYIAFYVLVMIAMEVHKFVSRHFQVKDNSMEMSPSGKVDSSPSTIAFKYSVLLILSSASVAVFAVMLVLIVVD